MTARLRNLAPGVALGLLLIDVAGMVVLSVARPQFLSTYNLFVTGRDLSILLLVALAQMIVLSLGQMNLSIGSIGGLVAIIDSGLMVRYGLPVPVALTAGFVLGIVCGVVNGLLVYWTKINSFVLTLGTSYVFAGINLGITHATPFYHIPNEISAFGQARLGPFPIMAAVTIVLALLLAFFLSQVVLGRQLLAVGGNALAARLSGLPIRRATLTAHAISGFLAAMAGTMLMAQLGQGQPTIGATWVLPSFAGPIIGGAALAGGSAPILGTVLAMVLISLIDDGLVLVSADPFWVQFLIGALILGAVVLGRARLSDIRTLLRISASSTHQAGSRQ
ncbi:MAG TPA: ABC transporter permease [Candidatus Dormibacteraeota bacterium]|nr:ABC transporter permease [Candidatus Dormibacteraeota bacterium]